MTHLTFALIVLTSAALFAAQEREVPKDSDRVTVPGCARGRSFIVGERAEQETVLRSDVPPGRRLRLSGPKKVLDDIKARESYMVELTGLVRKGQMAGPGGVSIAGGRVRIGGGAPAAPIYADPRRDPFYNEPVIDIESWRPMPEPCPSR